MPQVTIQELLDGTYYGRRQSVGNMDVIPILGEDDENYAPPDGVRVSTRDYGRVRTCNSSSRSTIVPPGSGWVVNSNVQDHAIGSGAVLSAGEETAITGYCIQQTQPGLIQESQEKEFVLLPLPLRLSALASRNIGVYSSLWTPISRFRSRSGSSGKGNLVDYLREFSDHLDRFVAHFECFPKQVGAVVLIDQKVVGVELAPSAAFWSVLWEPLIRVCYGSFALISKKKVTRPKSKLSKKKPKSVSELRASVVNAETQWSLETHALVEGLCQGELYASAKKEHGLLTVASEDFAGQYLKGKQRTPFISLVSNSVGL